MGIYNNNNNIIMASFGFSIKENFYQNQGCCCFQGRVEERFRSINLEFVFKEGWSGNREDVPRRR